MFTDLTAVHETIEPLVYLEYLVLSMVLGSRLL
jgi:hypothetical protein